MTALDGQNLVLKRGICRFERTVFGLSWGSENVGGDFGEGLGGRTEQMMG